MKLTDNQKRHLTVYLAQVEDAVHEVQRLALEPTTERALRSDQSDLADNFLSASGHDLAEVRSGLADLAGALGLEPLKQSRSQATLALLTMAMVQLEDAGSRGLRGYGELDPELPETLDPILDRLKLALVRVAQRVAVRRHRVEPTP